MAELDDPARLAQFKASIMHLDNDGVLEDCVPKAAAAAEAPIALVTFVMSKIQLFRAAVGLPPELAATRATSRCDSFCQFVVMTEGPFIVTNAKIDARVPQNMVETYGIAAYLGVPIHAGGQVLRRHDGHRERAVRHVRAPRAVRLQIRVTQLTD